MDFFSVVKRIYNPLETIDRMAAETKLMNVIRRLILMTTDIRPKDIENIADCIDKQLCDILGEVGKRSTVQPARFVLRSRKGEKKMDFMG